MKMKFLFSLLAGLLLSVVFATEADAQRYGPRGKGIHRGGRAYVAPRVAVVIAPPVRFSPPPRYPVYRKPLRHRHSRICDRGHRGCRDPYCYNDGYRRDRYDRGYYRR